MKRIFCFLSALLTVFLTLSLCSCDTTVFNNEKFTVSASFDYGSEKSADGRYLITGFNSIYDTNENKTIELQFEKLKRGELYYTDISFDNSGDDVTLKVNAFKPLYYYKVEDGSLDYTEYQPTTYTFSLDGKQIDMTAGGEALSKEEFDNTYNVDASFKKPNSLTKGIENFENYSISNSVYEYRYNEEKIQLTELENKLLDAIFDCENIKISDDPETIESFYQFSINAKRIDGKIYFSYRYCNKKDFMSQYSVKAGFRSSALLSYDERSGEIEEILRLGKRTCIMAYSDSSVIYYENDKLICKDLDTEKETVLQKSLLPRVHSLAFDDRVVITVSDYENKAAQIGETDKHTYNYTLDGKLLSES